VSASADPPPSDSGPPAAQPAATRLPAEAGKPRFALFVATACGLGYNPFAPGTWGSLAGLQIATGFAIVEGMFLPIDFRFDSFLFLHCVLYLAISVAGVWSASRTATFWGEKDPQRVVIDEVSGQYLTILVGCGLPIASAHPVKFALLGVITLYSALHWKYLLVGFILFRLFDIWKPFPVRQAESLPGGWGIMADDWVAAVYAGIGLWIARAAGL